MTLFLKLLVATGTIGTAVAVPTAISLTSSKSIDNNLRVERTEERVSEDSASTGSPSSPLVAQAEVGVVEQEVSSQRTEAEKLLERAENTNLCNEVAKSSDGSFLRVCKEKEGSTNVEFEYYISRFNAPSPIKHLRFGFGSREIVITLEEQDNYGHKSVRMDLSDEILSGSGLFSSFAGGKDFTSKQCKLAGAYESKKDWKINCQ